MNSELSTNIEQAWGHRLSRNLDESYSLYIDIKADLDVEELKDFETILSKTDEEQLPYVLDFILLGSSLARAYKNQKESQDLLEMAKKTAKKKGLRRHYYLQQEEGLNAWMKKNFHRSMECFVLAKKSAQTDRQRFLCLQNILFLCDNLNLPSKKVQEELEELNKKIKAPLFSLKTLDLHQKFRNGKIEEIINKNSQTDNTDNIGQDSYFRLFVSSLPYHKTSQYNSKAILEDFGLSHHKLYHGDFRLRTLQGILHSRDLEVFDTQDMIDRVYNWTWRWLINPESMHVDKILTLIDKGELLEKVSALTVEDTQMLHNSLLWLTLFGQRHLKDFKRLIGKVHIEDSFYPLFELEYLTIKYLFALRDGETVLLDDYKKVLETHSLWKEKNLFFKDLIDCIENQRTESKEWPLLSSFLLKNLNKVIYRNVDDSSAMIFVDLNKNFTLNKKTREQTLSPSISFSLDLLKTYGIVDCATFVNRIYGYYEYDSFIHDPKIHNLLTRLKRLCRGVLHFGVKNGQVYSKGDWSQVSIIKSTKATEQLHESSEWKGLLSKGISQQLKKRDLKEQAKEVVSHNILEEKESLSRSELQEIIQKPRSTTNRLIAQWVEEGLLIKEGSSRSTKYRVTKKFKKIIEEGI